jgi:hypothetical protein
MRAIRRSPLLVTALLLFTFAGRTAAQTTSSAVLNSLEVRQLITRAQPADHARLEVHFAVLAEMYAADARRHNAMAQAFIAKPTRQKAANSAADHCKRLEQLNLQSAATLRQLAVYHEGLAAGKASAAPRGADRFERGAGAPAATTEELTALAAKATTPGDHRALEEYFVTVAKQYGADANDHLAMAQAYRSVQVTQAAEHCDRLITLSRDEVKEAAKAASMHKQLAGAAR